MAKNTGHEGQKQIWVDADVHGALAVKAKEQRYRRLSEFVSRVLRDYVEGKIVEADAFSTTELLIHLYAKGEIDDRKFGVLLQHVKTGDLSPQAVSRRTRLSLKSSPDSRTNT